MAIPSKERGTFKGLDIPVDINERMDPIGVKFKAPSWSAEKSLDVLGISNHADLVLTDVAASELADVISMNQYILADDEMNVYEAFIITYKDPIVAKMRSIRTVPPK